MSKAKSDGGMGFRNFRAMNEAHLARQGWRMLRNPNSYWAKILKGLYFPNCSFLEAARGHKASFLGMAEFVAWQRNSCERSQMASAEWGKN